MNFVEDLLSIVLKVSSENNYRQGFNKLEKFRHI